MRWGTMTTKTKNTWLIGLYLLSVIAGGTPLDVIGNNEEGAST